MKLRESSTQSGHTNQISFTLQEIAGMMDLTRERVRQIEAKALLKFAKRLKALQISRSDLISS
jgi:DNA-directed RNA polymerase sigma subunit (sigma70/sigma32)